MGWTLAWGSKLLFAALVGSSAVLGGWIASSLAAYSGGPIWAAVVVGLLACPVLPLLWELGASLRTRKRPAILTRFDRLVLRTLALNLLFLGALLAAWPGALFTALTTRGDWMLEGRGAWADPVRRGLFVTADRLEWFHEWVHDNPYVDLLDTDEGDAVTPEVSDDGRLDQLRERLNQGKSADGPQPGSGADPFTDRAWPWRPQLHPAVQAMPPEVDTSIESVAAYLVREVPDPQQRLKAVHDYVADRVAYDVPSYRAHQYPPQDAQTVFETRLSVCAGYANLAKALGDRAGLEIVVVAGDARGSDGTLSGEGHAWNAARLGDRWVLFDATWDAGSVGEGGFKKGYETTFLMSPPEVFGVTHFPEDPKWQLRREPLSRGDFLRQPNLRGSFYAWGLGLEAPTRSQSDVTDALNIEVDNPSGVELTVAFSRRGDTSGVMSNHCSESGAGRFRCRFDTPGAYDVGLFGPDEFFGTLQVNAR